MAVAIELAGSALFSVDLPSNRQLDWNEIMTYEEYLDEVTTLITELYDLSDVAAIKHVMRAQADNFFARHDEEPTMRTQERAEHDAKTIFEQRNKSRPELAHKRSRRAVGM
ncbi:hypothetical protein [Undibacterium arcticum]